MFGRKFKPDYKSKKYIGCEEGTNLAVDIILPPKNDISREMFGVWFIATLFGSLALGFIFSCILGIICALINLYNATEKIDE